MTDQQDIEILEAQLAAAQRQIQGQDAAALLIAGVLRETAEAALKAISWTIMGAAINYTARKTGYTAIYTLAVGIQALLIMYLFGQFQKIETILHRRIRRIEGRFIFGLLTFLNIFAAFGCVLIASNLSSRLINALVEIQIGRPL